MKTAHIEVTAFSIQCPCGYDLIAANGSLFFTPAEMDMEDDLECPECKATLRLPSKVTLYTRSTLAERADNRARTERLRAAVESLPSVPSWERK